MNDLVSTLKNDLRAKLSKYTVVDVAGTTVEAFKMFQMIGDDSMRGFRELPEGRNLMVAVWQNLGDPDDEGLTVRMVRWKSGEVRSICIESVFIDFCDGEFVIVKMMD